MATRKPRWTQPADEHEPRTALGRRLEQLRAEIVAAGTPLLSWRELERELEERRGEAPRTDGE